MKRLLLAAALALLPGLANAGDIAPADLKTLHDYSLSMEKVRAMQAVMDDIARAEASDPALKTQEEAIDNSQNLAQEVARLKANPKLMAIFARHGITPQDAVVMPLVLMGAGVAAAYPQSAAKLADQTSPEQIAFFKAHEAELKKMSWLYGSDNGGQ